MIKSKVLGKEISKKKKIQLQENTLKKIYCKKYNGN